MPLELIEGMAMRHEAHTGLVVQMHYNTISNPDDRTDQSTLGIRASTEAPDKEAWIELFGLASQEDSAVVNDPPFEVPLGAEAHIESYTETYDDGDYRLWGFVPHMHLTGTALRMYVQNESEDTCLLNVPRYDYNWQQMYQYDATWEGLPELSEGGSLTVECTYHNSESNVMLKEWLGGPVTEGVRLGKDTHQEMCIVAVGFACDGLCP